MFCKIAHMHINKKDHKKKLLLIYPQCNVSNYADFGPEISHITGKRGGLINISLPTVAALTPSDFKIRIIDENVESINFNEPYDLVGITGNVVQYHRARQIAAEFTRRNILVVCGGPSVSVSPERWKPFADVLIIGEAERIWPLFIRDYLSGTYKAEYRETEKLPLSSVPVPDFSGFSKKARKQYLAGIVQASRGCPYNCDFCFITVYAGRKIRYKPVATILREVEQIYRMKMMNFIVLADDNFSAVPGEAKKILRALRDWNLTRSRAVFFGTQLSIEIAEDDEFLKLASEAGLNRVFVGIETPNLNTLKEVHKYQNLRGDMLKSIKKFHAYGIQVTGNCMVGFDNDDLSVFREQFEFYMQSGIPNIQVIPLQAPEGTPVKKRMIQEGRYVDWETGQGENGPLMNEFNTYTVIPRQMNLEQLKQGIYWLLWQLYRPENFAERLRLFYENYENSKVRQQLAIPKPHINLKTILITGRVIIELLVRGARKYRKIFRRMFIYAWHSSHPGRFEILLLNFLIMINARQILLRDCPEIEQYGYPGPQEGQ